MNSRQPEQSRSKKPPARPLPDRASIREAQPIEEVQRSLASLSSPASGANVALRQAAVLQLQKSLGNETVRRLVVQRVDESRPPAVTPLKLANTVQRKGKKKGGGDGSGPGKVKGAKETPYEVSGKTLKDLKDQLERFDGYASETYVALTIDGQVVPKQVKGQLQVTVKWKAVDIETQLPKWKDYKDACPAAQKEWDRFMKQLRKHEETAHVKMSKTWVGKIDKADKVFRGSTVDELQELMNAKQVELGEKLQEKHDACDHGKSIDAFLDPDKGVCE